MKALIEFLLALVDQSEASDQQFHRELFQLLCEYGCRPQDGRYDTWVRVK